MKSHFLVCAIGLSASAAASADFVNYSVVSAGNIGGRDVYRVFANFNESDDVLLNFFNHSTTAGGQTGILHNDFAGGSWNPAFTFLPDQAANDSYVTMNGMTGATASTALDPSFGSGAGTAIPHNAGWYNSNPGSPIVAGAGMSVMIMQAAVATGDNGWTADLTCGWKESTSTSQALFGYGSYASGWGAPPDCNGNGLNDSIDITSGTSLDVNGDGIPDECEPDCNSNGTPDSWDIQTGYSEDIDGNGVPDECKSDCNGNFTPDAYEIATGAEQDCDGNSIPDSCEDGSVTLIAPDLGALIAGVQLTYVAHGAQQVETDVALTVRASGDLAGSNEYATIFLGSMKLGTAFVTGQEDCGANGSTATFAIPAATWVAHMDGAGAVTITIVPSAAVNSASCSNAFTSVEVWYGGPAYDCDGDGQSDFCQIASGSFADCNNNKAIDSCEIAAGTSADVDSDGVPDECQPDCNGNGFPDSWELAQGWVHDCNGNGEPDLCDIANGWQDETGEGIPDACQGLLVPVEYSTIQAAVDAAVDGDVVLLSAGTYHERLNLLGKRIQLTSTKGPDYTTMSGVGMGNQGSLILCATAETSQTIIQGITFADGLGGSPVQGLPGSSGGGAISIYGTTSLPCSPSVVDCRFVRCQSTFGGAIYLKYSGSQILSCTFGTQGVQADQNIASSDGGNIMWFSPMDGLIETCDFFGGVATNRGGAIAYTSLLDQRPAIRSSTIVGATCHTDGGGGIDLDALGTSRLELRGSSVTSCSSVQGGAGGVHSSEYHRVDLYDSTLCGSSPANIPLGEYVDHGGNTICGCSADFNLDGQVNGLDLSFLYGFWGLFAPEYNLAGNDSDLIDGGDLTVLLQQWSDCGGDPGFTDDPWADPFATACDLNHDGVVDAGDMAIMLGAMGTSGSAPGPSTADLNADGLVDGRDHSILLAHWGARTAT